MVLLATPAYQAAQECLSRRGLFNARDIEFLESILPNGVLSAAQEKWLRDLVEREQLDFDKINAAAMSVLRSLVTRWLPSGEVRGHEYVALNPQRADNRLGSFRVNLNTGKWADFAAADARGGDPVSLAAYLHHGNDQIAAAKALKAMLSL